MSDTPEDKTADQTENKAVVDLPEPPKNIYKIPVKDLKFKDWIYRFQIPICIGFGMLGFGFSVYIMASPFKKPTAWGELTIVNKVQLVDTLIDKRVKTINLAIKKLGDTPPASP